MQTTTKEVFWGRGRRAGAKYQGDESRKGKYRTLNKLDIEARKNGSARKSFFLVSPPLSSYPLLFE